MHYKVRIKNTYSLGPCNWKDIRENILLVSLDNRRNLDLHLLSILKWSEREFDSTHILLADNLQCYNISFENDINIKTSKLLAYKRGTEWINQSAHILNKFKKIKKISRWNDWLIKYNDMYKSNLKKLINLYKDDLFIRDGINLICDEVGVAGPFVSIFTV